MVKMPVKKIFHCHPNKEHTILSNLTICKGKLVKVPEPIGNNKSWSYQIYQELAKTMELDLTIILPWLR